jgi:Domain of unknown function (DUF4340)
MNTRTTLVLVIVALIIGGVVVLDHYKGTSHEEAVEKGKRIVDFKSTDVTKLELAFTNQTFVLEKTGDRWNLFHPLAVRADASTVNSILDELEFAERDRTLSEEELSGVNLADFGLAQPRVRVTLTAKKQPVTLRVGKETPTKDALYVQVEGSKRVSVTRKSLFDRLNVGLDNLRSRVAVEFTPSAATRLEIRSVDRSIELAKSAATTNAPPRWAIVRPLAARADQQKVSELLTALNDLRIQDFVSEDPKVVHTYQLEDPEREVTVWSGDTAKTLMIGRELTNDTSKVYAKLKTADSIFTVSTDAAKKFALQINDLRDPHVLTFNDADVRGIELTRGADKISLSRTDETWNLTAPVAIAAEDSAVRQLLTNLAMFSATQFVADVATDLDKYGLATPAVTVTLQGESTNVLAQLLIGGLDDSNTLRYAKRTDEPFIYGVESNVLEWLPASALALRTHRLAEIQPDQIKKLTIQKGPVETVLERDAENKWKLVLPPQGVIDNDGLKQVLDAFCELRALEFIREGHDNLAEYELNTPAVTINVQAGDKTYTLALGKAPDAARRYALWSEPPLICSIGVASANTLSKDIVSAPPATNAPPAAEIQPTPTNDAGSAVVAPSQK